MRTWERARSTSERCGRCGAAFGVGDPMQRTAIPGLPLKQQLKRCTACADGPVPADLPPLPNPKSVDDLAPRTRKRRRRPRASDAPASIDGKTQSAEVQ